MEGPDEHGHPLLGATSRALAERIVGTDDVRLLEYMTSFVTDVCEALAHGGVSPVFDALRARASARGVDTDRALDAALGHYGSAGHVLRAALRARSARTEERHDVITEALHIVVAAVSRQRSFHKPRRPACPAFPVAGCA